MRDILVDARLFHQIQYQQFSFRQVRRYEINSVVFAYSIALLLGAISSRWLKALFAFGDVPYEPRLI